MPQYQYTACPMAFSRADGSSEQWTKGGVTAPVDDYTRRLLDREILIGNGDGCQPTGLSFVPKVTVPEGKTKVMLRARLNTSDGRFIQEVMNITTGASVNTTAAHLVAHYLFLVSGVDLMRQRDVRDYFDYSPKLDVGADPIAAGDVITITGYGSELVGDGVITAARQVKTDLTFMLIPPAELPADAVDFTALQWGEEKTVHSCTALINIGT